MIFGQSNANKLKKEQQRLRNMAHGIKAYAWLPIKLETGQWIWLSHYYCFYRATLWTDGRVSTWSAAPDSNIPIRYCYINDKKENRHITKEVKSGTNICDTTYERIAELPHQEQQSQR